MKYETQILEAYDRIGFKPRDRQVEHIDRIVTAFLDEGAKNVILSAPTGTGKSIIGTVVGEVLHAIKKPEIKEGASFLLSATNVLLDQYHGSFGDPSRDPNERFLVLKGAGNYECGALSTPEEPQSAENCAIGVFRKSGAQDIIDANCGSCAYRRSRDRKATAAHIITNYSFYFIDRMYSSAPMPRRTLCVFDEAHLLNDLFTEHNAIYVSEKRIAKMVDEVSEALTLGSTNVFRELKAFKDAMVAGRITEDPEIYQHWLKRLLDAYTEISDAAKAAAERNSRSPAKYLKFQKLHKKYYGLGCKIDDLFQFGYPVVFEHKPKDIKKQQHEDEISVKPIFVGEMFAVLDNADHNLLMSATISKQYAERTLVLPEKTVHIRLEPQFPKENKRVVFFKPQALNYNSMKSPDTVKKLTSASRQIVDHHSALGERGIVLAPSFAVVQEIATVLRQKSPRYTVFEHQRGDKLADLLEDFKRWDKGPAVMLTPSGFEGLDLPGDLSRYQIIVKAPFGSLGDKRVKTILDLYPDIYSLTTLMKIVQGAGRSVRSMEDHATTYMLDTGIQRLWTAKNNEWAPEFHTVFTSNLGPVDTE